MKDIDFKAFFDYELLDCGEFKKLERFGPFRFVRPAPGRLAPIA